MSQTRFDSTLTIVAEDMHFRPSEELSRTALELFIQLFPYAEEYKAETFDHIQFISPELFAWSAICPECGIKTQRENSPESAGRKWFAHIDEALAGQSVENTTTVLPA